MHPTDELIRLLKRLKLSGVLQSLDIRVRQALDDDLTHGEFLLRLFSDEVERREAKQLDTRLRRASFEHGTTLEDFDFSFNPEIPKAKLLELATCAFVDRHENVLLVGKTGLGKSHLAQALARRACRPNPESRTSRTSAPLARLAARARLSDAGGAPRGFAPSVRRMRSRTPTRSPWRAIVVS